MNSPTVRIGLLVLAAVLALSGLGGTALAAGDLFDDAYADCPHKTRLRDGQIADLTVARDAEEEDHVNVAWAATDPATWGLGPNAYSTSLVVILDDGGDLETRTLALGARKATFEGVATGTEVKVQMAIVVDTAEGDYLISDILETSINQSLSKPSFSTGWTIKGAHDGFLGIFTDLVDIPLDDLADDMGRMYYIGYNENFANYRPGTAVYKHVPATPRLRIGLLHGGENDGARDDVKFDAYVIRLIDADGDVVPEGDDVRMVKSDYGQDFETSAATDFTDGYYDRALVLEIDNENVYSDINSQNAEGEADRALLVADKPYSNVRVNKGGTIMPAAYQNSAIRWPSDSEAPIGTVIAIAVDVPGTGDVYAPAPDVHRDFPIDTLASDRTYTIEAWAVNEDHEVISPKATLKVRPSEQPPTALGGGARRFQDYRNTPLFVPPVPAVTSGTLLTTVFTVLE
jgi:hypothetical protein